MIKELTPEGYKKLQEEFVYRTTDLRQEIATAIKEAKEQGDLSENADYTAARQQQSENESRIVEIEAILKIAKVAKKTNSGVIEIGSFIKVKSGSITKDFVLVGSNEVDPSQGKISNESPLGKAFVGHKKGDIVEVETPVGKTKFEILEVK